MAEAVKVSKDCRRSEKRVKPSCLWCVEAKNCRTTNRSSPLIDAHLEPQKSAHGKHGIHGRLSPEDWPQRGAEVTKRRRGFEPLICANLEPRIAHGTHGGQSQNFLLRMSRISRMIGEQGTIRAIRVICGENSSEDWPQRGTEVTTRRRHFEPLIDANRR